MVGVWLLFVSGCAMQPSKTKDGSFFGSDVGQSYLVKKGDTLYSVARVYRIKPQQLAANNGIAPPYIIYAGQSLSISGDAALLSSSVPDPDERAFFKIIQEKGIKTSVVKERVALVEPLRRTRRSPIKSASGKKLCSSLNCHKSEKKARFVKKTSVKQIGNEGVSFNYKDSGWIYPVKGKVIKPFSSVGKLSKGIDFAAKTGSKVISSRSGKVVYAGSRLKGYGNLIIIKHDETYLSAYAHNRSILVREGEIIRQGQKIAEVGSTGTYESKLHFQIRRFGKPINPLKLLKQ